MDLDNVDINLDDIDLDLHIEDIESLDFSDIDTNIDFSNIDIDPIETIEEAIATIEDYTLNTEDLELWEEIRLFY